ncbi:ABC transporter permease [Lacrimispora sp.]|jgi:hypothetical protein|uniref:ABC transporter permease n=1 Tax=Lacrimispora sp. TaxID=2719234 RepID=UPI0028999C71|nr:ABC transporter permease [Lacrimispora sp.]
MKIWIWFILSCKRQLKHSFFVVMLLLMPLLLLGSKRLEQTDSGKIRIGVYQADSEEDISEKVIARLIKQDGMFQFYECSSRQNLQDDVAARRAECGYIFTENLKQKLDDKKFKRSIEVYSAPSTISAGLSKEVVFSHLIDVYGEEILAHFVTTEEIFADFNKDQIRQEIKDIYQEARSNGSTFSFRYETLSAEVIEEGIGKIAFPVRGMVAVYLLVVGLFSAVTLIQDERKGLFIPLSNSYRLSCKLTSMAAPVVLSAVSGLITIFVTSNWTDFWKEITFMFIYTVAIVVFGYLCKMAVRDPEVLCGFIPFFILGSLIFSQVFIDVTKWIPETAPIKYLFLPYYYLKLF